jgi:hypothetical protein
VLAERQRLARASPSRGTSSTSATPSAELQRRLERVGEPALDALSAHEPVDDHLDGVVLVPGELVLARRNSAMSTSSPSTAARTKPWPARSSSRLSYSPLRPLTTGREHLEPGAVGQQEDAVDDLLRGLRCSRRRRRAVLDADAGVEQAQVVVHLGDRADCRARVLAAGLLVDRDRRRQPLDDVDVRLVHLPEELAGVRAEALDVAALPSA